MNQSQLSHFANMAIAEEKELLQGYYKHYGIILRDREEIDQEITDLHHRIADLQIKDEELRQEQLAHVDILSEIHQRIENVLDLEKRGFSHVLPNLYPRVGRAQSASVNYMAE